MQSPADPLLVLAMRTYVPAFAYWERMLIFLQLVHTPALVEPCRATPVNENVTPVNENVCTAFVDWERMLIFLQFDAHTPAPVQPSRATPANENVEPSRATPGSNENVCTGFCLLEAYANFSLAWCSYCSG